MEYEHLAELLDWAIWVTTPLLTVGSLSLVKLVLFRNWRIDLSYLATALIPSAAFLLLHPQCGCIGFEAQALGALGFSFVITCVLLVICWLINVAAANRAKMLTRIGRNTDTNQRA